MYVINVSCLFSDFSCGVVLQISNVEKNQVCPLLVVTVSNMKGIYETSKTVAGNAIVERSEVMHTRSRTTRSKDVCLRSEQSERYLRKIDSDLTRSKRGRTKVDAKTDRYIIKNDKGEIKGGKRKGSSVRDQVNHATQLKQIFQQSAVLPNKLDDFSSGCTPFRKIVEKKGKRLRTEVTSGQSKKPCLEKCSQIEEERQKCLQSDCVMSYDVKVASTDSADGGSCDDGSADSVAGSAVQSYVFKECVGTGNVRMDLSDYKYPGRKRMVGENKDMSHGNRQMLPGKKRKFEVSKKTSDERSSVSTERRTLGKNTETECEKLNEIRNVSCDEPTTRVESMQAQDKENGDMVAGMDGTVGDEELAAILQQREEEKVTEEQLTEKEFIFCQICQKELNHMNVHRRQLHVNHCAEQVCTGVSCSLLMSIFSHWRVLWFMSLSSLLFHIGPF